MWPWNLLDNLEQGKSEGFGSCDRPSNVTQIGLKLSIFQPMWAWMRITEDSSAYSESFKAWWRHHMETYSALLAICVGNSPVPGKFPTQRPVTQSFDVFFDLCLNKRLRKQSWGWWFEMLSCPLWRHCNGSGVYQLRVLPGQGDSSAPSTTDPLIVRFCLVTTDRWTDRWRDVFGEFDLSCHEASCTAYLLLFCLLHIG